MTTNPASAVELLACPFCGSESSMSFFARTSGPEPAGHFVECESCSAAGPSFDIQGEMPDRIEYTKGKAVSAWNTRVQPTPASDDREGLVERLREALEAFVRHGRALGAFEDDGPFRILTDEGYREVPAEDFRRAGAALLSTPKPATIEVERLALEDATALESIAEEADENGWLDWAAMMRQAAIRFRAALAGKDVEP